MDLVAVRVQLEILLCIVGVSGDGSAGTGIWSSGPDIIPLFDTFEEVVDHVAPRSVVEPAQAVDVVVK